MVCKNFKIISIVVILMFAFSVLAVGCGSSQTAAANNSSTVGQASSETATADKAPAQKVKISYSHWQDNETSKIIKQKALDFTAKNPNIEVDTIAIPSSNYMDKMKALAASGELYDTFDCGDDTFVNFAKKGYLAEVSNVYTSGLLDKSIFKDTILKYNEVNGKTYAVPQTHNTMVVYYNADLFKKAGLPTPQELMDKDRWTWDNFLTSAKKLSAMQESGKKYYGFVFDPGWWGGYFGWMASNGGAPFDANGNPTFSSKETKQAIQFLYDGVKDGTFTLAQMLPKGVGLEQLFKTGTVGMFYSGRWSLQMLKDFKDFEFDIVPIPKSPAGKYGATVPWANICISAKSKNIDAAEKWIAFFAGDGSMKDFVGYQGLPASKNLDHLITDVGIPKHAQTYVDVIQYAVANATYPVMLESPEAATELSKKMQDIFVGAKEGRTNVDKDTAQLDESLKKILANK